MSQAAAQLTRVIFVPTREKVGWLRFAGQRNSAAHRRNTKITLAR